MNHDADEHAGEHRCAAQGCTRRCGRDDVICSRCLNALARTCQGKQRVDGYTARKRGERTGRGAYRCVAGEHYHQTRNKPGPGAYVVRAQAKRAVEALTQHRGMAWFVQLVESWDPASAATRRADTR